MDWPGINQNWALYAAVFPLSVVILAVVLEFRRRSSGGKLRTRLLEHRQETRKLKKAKKALATARRKLKRLELRAGKVKPRVMQAAKDAVADATALVKIADDKVQISANLVRKVILEEFPPRKQQRLRSKYFPDDAADARPFSF